MQVQLYVALWPVLLFPEMSDGHLQANARGGVSEETTSQLYALLIWHLQANARGGVSGETTSQLYALLLSRCSLYI